MPKELFSRLTHSSAEEAHQYEDVELRSEVWEQKRDTLIRDIKAFVQSPALMEGEVFYRLCEMLLAISRYSIKDGIRCARSIARSKEELASTIPFIISQHDRSLRDGNDQKRLKDRIMEALADEAALRAFNQEYRDWLPDDKKKQILKEFVQKTAIPSRDQDFAAAAVSSLLAKKDAVGDPSDVPFPTEQAFRDRIRDLYAPYYAGALERSSGIQPEKQEQFPDITQAMDFLEGLNKLEKEKPYYVTPLRELFFRVRFGIKPPEDAWYDTRIVFDRYTGQELPLREALRSTGLEVKNAGGAWELDLAVGVLTGRSDLGDTISSVALEKALRLLGIDTDDSVIERKIQQAQVTRLGLVVKLQAKGLREGVQRELDRCTGGLRRAEASVAPDEHSINFLRERSHSLTNIRDALQRVERGEESGYTPLKGDTWRYPRPDRRRYASSSVSRVFTKIRQIGAKDPEAVVAAIPAKVDVFSDEDIVEILRDLFPSSADEVAQAAQERFAEQRRSRWYTESWDRTGAKGPGGYFTPMDKSVGMDGDPRDPYPQKLASFSEPVTAILVNGVFQVQKNGEWTRGTGHIPQERRDDLVYTTTAVQVPATLGMCLPVPLFGLIHGRVVGIRQNGSQCPVETRRDEMGRTIVQSFAKDTVSVAYSVDVPTPIPAVEDIDSARYDAWYTARLKGLKEPNRQKEAMQDLPNDLLPFIEKVRTLAPADRVRAIEGYVRSIGYYDFANGETRGNRFDVDLRTRWRLMRERLDVLKKRHPQNAELAARKIAGVCVDFQELASTMLNAAGCIAGKISALRVHDAIEATNKSSHALSYVEWPNAQGGIDVMPVDGTPSGIDAGENEELDRIREPSQIERLRQQNATRFEQEMDERTHVQDVLRDTSLTRTMSNLQEAFGGKATFAKKEGLQEATTSLADVPRWRERFASYIQEVLPQEEIALLTSSISWLAYSGVLSSSRDAEDLSSALTEVLRDIIDHPPSRATQGKDQANALIRDWESVVKSCQKRGIPLPELEKAFQRMLSTRKPGSKAIKIITYLTKGFTRR